MNTKHKWLNTMVAGVAAFGISNASASSHREAPAISTDPSADNTDLWAWMSSDNSHLNIVASYIPMEEPSGGPNFFKFSDNVLYEVHITQPGVVGAPQADGGPTATYNLNDQVTLQIQFTTTPPPVEDETNLDAGPTSAAYYHVGGGKEFFSQLSLAHQTYTVTQINSAGVATVLVSGADVTPPNIGPRSQAVLNGLNLFGSDQAGTVRNFPNYNDAFAADYIYTTGTGNNVTSVWAGPRDDGFYADLGGIFDLANLRAASSTFADGGPNPPQDGVAGFNCHSIALSIPTTAIFTNGTPHVGTAGDDSTVGVWASASRKKISILRNDGTSSWYGPWVQVSRLGLPLINEAVIGLQDKDKYNRTTPNTDVANFAGYFLNPVIVRDAAAVGIYTVLGVTDISPYESGRVDILNDINLAPTHHIAIAPGVTGDVLRVDTAIASQFPNGRVVGGGAATNQDQVDVIDVLLSILLTTGTSGVSDGVNHNDKAYLATIPWLAGPWEGWSQGHGKPAP